MSEIHNTEYKGNLTMLVIFQCSNLNTEKYLIHMKRKKHWGLICKPSTIA